MIEEILILLLAGMIVFVLIMMIIDRMTKGGKE